MKVKNRQTTSDDGTSSQSNAVANAAATPASQAATGRRSQGARDELRFGEAEGAEAR